MKSENEMYLKMVILQRPDYLLKLRVGAEGESETEKVKYDM